jgi:hypothetical protein
MEGDRECGRREGELPLEVKLNDRLKHDATVIKEVSRVGKGHSRTCPSSKKREKRAHE